MPHRVDGGVTFIKDDEKWRGCNAFCKCVTVQILPVMKKKLLNAFATTIFISTEAFSFRSIVQIVCALTESCAPSTSPAAG